MNNQNQLYFAYGSNLNTDDLLHNYGFKHEDLTPVGYAYLLDRDLQFTRYSQNRGGGVLDVVPHVGSLVHGIVFKVKNEMVWQKLDRKEGAPFIYRRIKCKAALLSGKLESVITYEVRPGKRAPEGFVQPSTSYLNTVKSGYEIFEIPNKYLESAVRGNFPSSSLDSFFTYGTLMRYEQRHQVIKAAKPECILLAEAYGHLIDCGNFPAMILSDNNERMVQGEFCRFSKDKLPLKELDRIEGFHGWGNPDNLFNRTIIQVGMVDGRVRIAWTYIWGREIDQPIIKSGDWRIKNNKRDIVLKRLVEGHVGVRSERELFKKLNSDWYCHLYKNIVESLKQGYLSERKLAQISGKWAVY